MIDGSSRKLPPRFRSSYIPNDDIIHSVAELQVLTVLMVRHFGLRTVVHIRAVSSLFTIFPGVEGKDAEGAQVPLELRIL